MKFKLYESNTEEIIYADNDTKKLYVYRNGEYVEYNAGDNGSGSGSSDDDSTLELPPGFGQQSNTPPPSKPSQKVHESPELIYGSLKDINTFLDLEGQPVPDDED